jgi:hypothetical protein
MPVSSSALSFMTKLQRYSTGGRRQNVSSQNRSGSESKAWQESLSGSCSYQTKDVSRSFLCIMGVNETYLE